MWWDGIKIRENANDGKVLYVNICSHSGLSKPKNEFGHDVQGEILYDTSNAEIPMIIGVPRDEKTNSACHGNTSDCIAIDVIVHPIVINTSKVNNTFCKELCELIFGCIESETILKVNRSQWNVSSRSYECGRGDDRLIPVLFSIQKDCDKNNDKLLLNPSTLMETVLKERDSDCNDIHVTSTVKSSGNIIIPVDDSEIKQTFQLKKGFLNGSEGFLRSQVLVVWRRNPCYPHRMTSLKSMKCFKMLMGSGHREVESVVMISLVMI